LEMRIKENYCSLSTYGIGNTHLTHSFTLGGRQVVTCIYNPLNLSGAFSTDNPSQTLFFTFKKNIYSVGVLSRFYKFHM
jgi:hypothetical protein